ncbi:MAG: hypothetical protein ACJ8F7_16730, partial [Gemmataceae bacterium]
MPRFRPCFATWRSSPLSPTAIAESIEEVLTPGHFYVAPPLHLAWSGPTDEDVVWEIFRGRALDRSQTRSRQRFLAWNVRDLRDEHVDEPLLSVKWDPTANKIFVTRSILCHAWEGF